MNNHPPSKPSPVRMAYSFLFWVVVWIIGLVVGSTLAWFFGARTADFQILIGMVFGFAALFATNRWVRRQRRIIH